MRKTGEFGHDVSVNRKEFQTLSRIRLREARALFKLGMHDGAYYLAGYSVECALKVCIAKATLWHDFPDKKRADLSYTLVSVDLEKGSRMLQILDDAGLDVKVSLWAVLAEYEDWRLVLSSRKFDAKDLGKRMGSCIKRWTRPASR